MIVGFWGGKPHVATAEEICDKWLIQYDVDRDGTISKKEFEKMAEDIDFSHALEYAAFSTNGDDAHGKGLTKSGKS